MTRFLRNIPVVGSDLWELVRHPEKGVTLIAAHQNLAIVTPGLLGFWAVALFAERAIYLQELASGTVGFAGGNGSTFLGEPFSVLLVLSSFLAFWLLPPIIWHALLRAVGRKGSFVSLLTITGHAFLVPIIIHLPLTVMRMMRYFPIPLFDSLWIGASYIWIACMCALSMRELYGVSKAKAVTITVVGAILTPVVYGLVAGILLFIVVSLSVILHLTGAM